jgi:hypothetical protein
MTDPYDDPRVAVAEGKVTFDEIGDRAKGRIVKLDVFTGMGNGWRYELVDAAVKQRGRQERWDTATITATAGQLVAQLKEQRPRVGDTLDIELIDLRKAAQGTAKIFNVETQKAMVPVNTDSAGAPDDDPFA